MRCLTEVDDVARILNPAAIRRLDLRNRSAARLLIQQTLQVGQLVTTDLFKAVAGTFDQPVPSDESLEKWGTLAITVIDCTHITTTMDTKEGLKVSNTVKIAGVVGLNCTN